jgi:hypothetical protein
MSDNKVTKPRGLGARWSGGALARAWSRSVVCFLVPRCGARRWQMVALGLYLRRRIRFLWAPVSHVENARLFLHTGACSGTQTRTTSVVSMCTGYNHLR